MTTKTLKDIIKIGVFLALLTPLVVSPKFYFPFVGPKSLYFMGLIEIVFAVWLILMILEPKYRFRPSLLFWALVLFLYFLVFSSALGLNFSHSFWSKYERMTGLLMWFHLLAFFIVLSSVFKKWWDWLPIFGVSVGAGSLVALISFFPESIPFFKSTKQGATLGNSSFLGTYLLFNSFLALILFFKTSGKWKYLAGAALILMVLATYINSAQAAFLSFFGGLFLLFLLSLIFTPLDGINPRKSSFLRWLFSHRRALKITGLTLLLAVVLLTPFFIYFAFQPDSFVQKTLLKYDLYKKPRVVIWEIAWKGWQDRPWLGWGLENFNAPFARYFNPCLFLKECGSEIWFDRAHNIILDVGITTGFLGLISYLTIFGTSFYLLFRKYLDLKQKPKLSGFRNHSIELGIIGCVVVLLVAYFIQNLTVFDMVSSYMMFFLVLGFLDVLTRRDESGFRRENNEDGPRNETRPRWRGFHKIVLAAFLVLSMLFSFFHFVFNPYKADQYVIRALEQREPTQRVAWYKKTLETSPLGKYQIRDFFGQQVLNFARSGAVRKVKAGDFKKEVEFVIEELEKSRKALPLSFRARLTLGQLYNLYAVFDLQKGTEKAEEVLKEAIELSPRNQQGYWALAQTKTHQKKFKEAYVLAEKALKLEPRVAQAHLIVVQTAEMMGDRELAKQKAEEALEMHPGLKSEMERILNRK